MNSVDKKIRRLYFEDFLIIVFICLSILNLVGDYYEREYLKYRNVNYKRDANNIFDFTLSITVLIYLYFVVRNYNSYKSVSNDYKVLYSVKLFGSILIIVGAVCLLYFQKNQKNFVGIPAI